MRKYIVRRLIAALAVMFLVSALSFLVLDLIPGNAAMVALGTEADADQLAALEASLGLDRPIVERLATFYLDLLHGDLGQSSYFGQSVSLLIAQRIGVTFTLAFSSVLLALLLALVLGTLAAMRKGTLADGVCRIVTQLAASIPSFWLSLILLILFSSVLHLVDVGAWAPFSQDPAAFIEALILPVAVLTVGELSPALRLVRVGMVDAVASDWYANARIRALPTWRLTLYALRSAIGAPLTNTALQLARLLGGTAIVESVFAIPGLGRLFLTAVEMRDLALVQGIVVFVTMLVVLVNLASDLLTLALNPVERAKLRRPA